jgi:ribosome biogenesis protein Nip4
MGNLNRFRRLNQTEKGTILRSLKNISVKLSQFFEENFNNLYIQFLKPNENYQYPKVYFLPNMLISTLKKIKKNSIIKSGGLYLGFIKKGELMISIEAIEYYLSTHSELFSDLQKINLTAEGEKSFLYGNNIQKDMIIDFSSSFLEQRFILVLNTLNELIGIALVKENLPSLEKLNSDEIVAINLQDKGYYLRKTQ